MLQATGAASCACSAARVQRVDARQVCCIILPEPLEGAKTSYLCKTTNIKGRVGRLIADNEQRILRKYTFELSQIRFS